MRGAYVVFASPLLVLSIVALACGRTDGDSVGESDASAGPADAGECSKSSGCMAGYTCVFPPDPACSIMRGVCAITYDSTIAMITYCACDGTNVTGAVSSPEMGAFVPVRHVGACDDSGR